MDVEGGIVSMMKMDFKLTNYVNTLIRSWASFTIFRGRQVSVSLHLVTVYLVKAIV